MRKLKKGITLIELVVSISVSTVIFVGVTGLLIFLSTTNSGLKKDAKNFYNANTLSHAIEAVMDENNSSLFNLPETKMVYEDEMSSDVPGVDVNTPKLFSVKKADKITHYYFYKQHFGYTDGTSLIFNNVYASDTKVKIEFELVSGSEYLLKINYGDNYAGHFSIIKNLVKGE